jgi:hypothetical protein
VARGLCIKPGNRVDRTWEILSCADCDCFGSVFLHSLPRWNLFAKFATMVDAHPTRWRFGGLGGVDVMGLSRLVES